MFVILFEGQFWTKGSKQIHEIEQNRFLYGMSYN